MYPPTRTSPGFPPAFLHITKPLVNLSGRLLRMIDLRLCAEYPFPDKETLFVG